MGAVYVAEHLKLHKQVAIKTIRADFAADSQAEARFTREALATASLDHPHVASALDYGHLEEGGAYLVIQLVRGHSLTKQIQRGPLPWLLACQLGAQVADALTAAHALGIVHRDLKPDNILLEPRDDGSFHARVVDFGIARLSGREDAGAGAGTIADANRPITRMGAVIGTPGYMAPEQAVGQQVDQRVDLYALGVILWECCAGKVLWDGDSLTDLYGSQLSKPAPSLRATIPGKLPAALSALIDQLLAREPNERPATAAIARDELRRIALTDEVNRAMAPAAAAAAPQSSTLVDIPSPIAPAPAPATAPTTTPPATTPTAPAPATTPATTTPTPTVPAPVAPASAIPRAVWLSGLSVVLLLLIAALISTTTNVPKDSPTKGPAVAAPAEPPAAPPSPASDPDDVFAQVPAAYREHARELLTSDEAGARERACAAIAEAPERDKPDIPEYIRNLAWFEYVPDCADKKPILAKIRDEGDLRALPALRRIAATPVSSCGAGDIRFECIECLREELDEVIARFDRAARR